LVSFKYLMNQFTHFLFVWLFSARLIWGQALTISEVMFNPVGADDYDEYIEIVNINSSAVDLKDTYLLINGELENLQFHPGDSILSSGQYALILDRGYLIDGKSSTYDLLIPEDALLLTIDNSAFGKGGLLNTTKNEILLVSANDDTLSRVLTTPDQEAGYSDEKIILDGPDSEDNWGNSQTINGTPGARNSISPCDSDLAIIDLRRDTDASPVPGEPVQFRLTIQNVGLNPIYNAEVHFGPDWNNDSVLVSGETVYTDILSLEPGDLVVLFPVLPEAPKGMVNVLAVIDFDDDKPQNNQFFFTLKVPYPKNCLVINEFMYAPRTDGGGEWVELYNISADTINLRAWTIGDNSTRSRITSKDIFILPREYVTLASDSAMLAIWDVDGIFIETEKAIPGLNNTKDSIVVRDHCDRIIDALEYSAAWGSQSGVSLERINPYTTGNSADNWGLSKDVSGATPNRPNSILIKNIDLAVDEIEVSPEELIRGDNAQITVRVSNRGLLSVYSYSARFVITDFIGNSLFDSAIFSSTSLNSGETEILNISYNAVPGSWLGIKVIVFCAGDEYAGNDTTSIQVFAGYPENSVIINEIMYAPVSGEPEWFEIYNRSDCAVDLLQWRCRDAGGKWKELDGDSKLLMPGDYGIVTSQGDFPQSYPGFDATLIVMEGFPVINNTADSLFLSDAIGHVVEAVCFKKDWGGATGISIERKDPNATALGKHNWGTSLAIGGASPGAKNSILKYRKDLSIIPKSFAFTDSVAGLIQQAEFGIAVQNSGSALSNPFSIELFYDANEDSNPTPDELVWSTQSIPSLLPDSVFHYGSSIMTGNSGRCRYIAVVEMSGEEYLPNNLACTDLLVKYPRNSLVINEFLAYPKTGQAEFVEFINISDDQVNFHDWYLANKRSSVRIKKPVTIKQGEYLVLTGDSSAFYNYFPPSPAPVIITSRWPGLNNSADSIILMDLTGAVNDQLGYDESWGIKAGTSLEKKLPELKSQDRGSWSESVSIFGATPGLVNSVKPLLYDLSLDSVSVTPRQGDVSTSYGLRAYISNPGRLKSNQSQLVVYDRKSKEQPIASGDVNPLDPGSGDTLLISIDPLSPGFHSIVAALVWTSDQCSANDSDFAEIRVSHKPRALLLSEFMAIPQGIETGNNSIAEYVELYNPGDACVGLEYWLLSDENTGRPVLITGEKSVTPRGYFVLASDSSIFNYPGVNDANTSVLPQFPSLNNSADCVVIKDLTGITMDSLRYTEQWDIAENVSLERVFFTNPNDLNNWRQCSLPLGGTPGQPNSVAVATDWKKPGIKVSPNPFSPDGDGIDDETAILFQLPFPSARISVEIYDLVGRLIYQPAKASYTAAEGAVYWDGSSKYGGKARIGMYIVRCTATDAMSDKSVGYVTTLVVAR
jgi:hypothetical protein